MAGMMQWVIMEVRMRLSELLTEMGRVMLMGVRGTGFLAFEMRYRRPRLKSLGGGWPSKIS